MAVCPHCLRMPLSENSSTVSRCVFPMPTGNTSPRLSRKSSQHFPVAESAPTFPTSSSMGCVRACSTKYARSLPSPEQPADPETTSNGPAGPNLPPALPGRQRRRYNVCFDFRRRSLAVPLGRPSPKVLSHCRGNTTDYENVLLKDARLDRAVSEASTNAPRRPITSSHGGPATGRARSQPTHNRFPPTVNP